MTDQVRVLDPPAGFGSPHRVTTELAGDEEASRPKTHGSALVGTLLLLLGLGLVLWLAPPPGADFGIAPSEIRPDFVAMPSTDTGLGAMEASTSIATVRELSRAINLGDSATVVDLLAQRAPGHSEFRRAEWPLLPTDAGWWHGGLVDHEAVEGSVRYVFTIPGSVFLSACDAQTSPTPPGGVTVTCDYTASGGPLKALGQQPEAGRLHVVLVDGFIAGVERHGTTDRALWSDFARWAVDHDEVAFHTTLGNTDSHVHLDPVYSGDSALIHVALAETMAREKSVGGGRAATSLR